MAETKWFGTSDESAVPLIGLEKWTLVAGGVLAILLSLAVIWVISIALLDEGTMRLGAITFGVLITLMTSPLVSTRKQASPTTKKLLWAIDLALLIGFMAACYWFYVTRERLWEGVFEGTPTDLATAAIGLVVILELTRRAWGLPLVIIALVGIVYGMFGNYAPSIIQHGGIDIDEFVRTIWYSFDGVFGRATGIVASVVLIFLIFGAMVESTGAGESLIRLSTAITARIRGGAAHAAIVASAVFGTMSGSVAANIAGTGVFTIPMIKRQGFSASFAGAVEAAASSGGQLTPPVMAAAAFVMADMVGKPYLLIIAAAALPALFKYLSLFAQVYTEAVRVGIKPLPPEERPKLHRGDIRNALLIFLPIACLMGTFFFGRSAAFAGLVGLISALVVGLVLNPDFRRHPMKILDALRIGGINSGRIMVAVAVIGIILGVLNETGIAIKFASQISTLGESSIAMALILSMFGALILGMGLPTLPAYLIIAIMLAPAIEKAGVPTIAAHMFVLYFAVYSSIVPPIAYACYVAAPIAGSTPMRTAVQALRISAVGLLVPYVFVFNPSLLLVVSFDAGLFVWVILRLLLAVWLTATGFGGADNGGLLPLPERFVRVVLGLMTLIPVPVLEIGGFVAGIAVIIYRYVKRKTAGRSGLELPDNTPSSREENG